ncbi:MAG: phage exclusion protein Lit family protein [Acidovorax sp.]
MRNLLFGIAPERRDELQALWDELQVEFCLMTDGGGVTLAGGAYRYVHFDHRALRVMWVCAFAAWESYAAVHSTLVEDGNAVRHGRFRALLRLAIEIRDVPDPKAVSLLGLPEPGHLPSPDSEPEARAAAELAMFAAGWAILHEVRYLRHQQEGAACAQDAAPQDAWKEELSCDQFHRIPPAAGRCLLRPCGRAGRLGPAQAPPRGLFRWLCARGVESSTVGRHAEPSRGAGSLACNASAVHAWADR